jgi:hypothetical protein
MQMYVWNGIPNASITTVPAVTIDDSPGVAAFGAETFDLTGVAVLANDGTAPTTDACQPLGATALGKIVVVDRGTCPFADKGMAAQTAGATGLIIVNNAAGHAAVSPGVPEPAVTIPVLGVSQEDGAKLKTALAAAPLTVHMKRGVTTIHDGTIDNTVVAHEWGHYLHHRLVPCGSASCGGMSEGWADFNALMMVVRTATRSRARSSRFRSTRARASATTARTSVSAVRPIRPI